MTMRRSTGSPVFIHQSMVNASWPKTPTASSTRSSSTTSCTTPLQRFQCFLAGNKTVVAAPLASPVVGAVVGQSHPTKRSSPSAKYYHPQHHHQHHHQQHHHPYIPHGSSVRRQTLVDEKKLDKLLSLLRSNEFAGYYHHHHHQHYHHPLSYLILAEPQKGAIDPWPSSGTSGVSVPPSSKTNSLEESFQMTVQQMHKLCLSEMDMISEMTQHSI